MTMVAQLYYIVRHKNFHGKVHEFGEQVLAKPKRSNKQVKKKGAKISRCHVGRIQSQEQ